MRRQLGGHRGNLAEWSPRDYYFDWLRALDRAVEGEPSALVVDWVTPALMEG